MRKTRVIIFLTAFSLQIYSQNKFIDSLHTVINKNVYDSVGLNALNILTTYYFTNNLDSAKKYSNIILQRAEKKGDKRAMARAYILMADIRAKKGDYAVQINYMQKGLELMEGARDTLGMMRVNIFLSEAFLVTNDLGNALLHAKKALEYYNRLEKRKIKFVIPKINNIFGRISLKQNQTTKALEYFTVAYTTAISEKIDDWYLASIIENMAQAYLSLKDIKKAKEYYQKSIDLNKHLNNMTGLNNCYGGLASVFVDEGQTDSALAVLERAKENAIKMGDKTSLLGIYDGFIYVFGKSGNGNKKAEYLELKSNLKDTLNVISNAKAIAEAKIKLSTHEREREVAFLNEKNKVMALEVKNSRTSILFIIAVAVFILLVILFRSRYNKLLDQKINMELERKLLSSQMNPHFLFNSLNSIQSFIMTGDKRLANRYLSEFSSLMRLSLDHSRKEFVPLVDEMKLIETYVSLEQVRFNNKFKFVFELSENLNSENIMIPPMLIQTFIENAILHGINNSEKKDLLIMLNFDLKNGVLLCTVKDNGIGYEHSLGLKKENPDEHLSAGIKITQERLKLICSNLKQPFFVEIKDAEGSGTIVLFNLPHKIRK